MKSEKKIKKVLEIVWRVMQNIIGVMLLIFAVMEKDIIAMLLFFITGVLCFPDVHNVIVNKMRIKAYLIAVAVLVLSVIAITISIY